MVTSPPRPPASFFPGQFGLVETDWTPTPGQSASVPYASMDIRADGTYGAKTFPSAKSAAVTVEGQWTRVRTKVDGRFSYTLTLTETTAWLFGNGDASAPHTFSQEARFDADWGEYYRVCFASGPSECVLYFNAAPAAEARQLVPLLVGPHTTAWTEGMGDQGPIPYGTIDFHRDGTYEALIHEGASRDGVRGSVAGKWSFVSSTNGVAVRMIESTAWSFSNHRVSERHVFVVDVAPQGPRAYSLGFMNASHEAPVFVANGAKQ
jgi:hypothetical protein